MRSAARRGVADGCVRAILSRPAPSTPSHYAERGLSAGMGGGTGRALVADLRLPESSCLAAWGSIVRPTRPQAAYNRDR